MRVREGTPLGLLRADRGPAAAAPAAAVAAASANAAKPGRGAGARLLDRLKQVCTGMLVKSLHVHAAVCALAAVGTRGEGGRGSCGTAEERRRESAAGQTQVQRHGTMNVCV